MKALVIGASGAIGRRTAAELVRSGNVERVICAGRRVEQVLEVAELLGGRSERVTGVEIDARDAVAVAAAANGCDIVVNASHASTEVAAARGAIKAGSAYVSACNDSDAYRSLVGLRAEAVGAGITIVSGCGAAPGLSNLLTTLAAEELDALEEIEISVALSSAAPGGAAAAEHIGECLSRAAGYVSEFRYATGRAGDLPRPVYFPEPTGWIETFNCGHPEVPALNERWPEVRSIRFRAGLTERAAMDLVRAGIALGLTRSARRATAWRRFTHRLRPVVGLVPPRGPEWSAVRVDAFGEIGGRHATVSLGVVDHLINLASVPLALGAISLGTSRRTTPGVMSADVAFDVHKLLSAAARRGIRIARLTPTLAESRAGLA